MDTFFDPSCVPVRVTINKLDFVPNGNMTHLVGVFWKCGSLFTSKPYVSVMFFYPISRSSPCFSDIHFAAFARNLINNTVLFCWSNGVFRSLWVASDLKRVRTPCCCRQRRRTSDTPFFWTNFWETFVTKSNFWLFGATFEQLFEKVWKISRNLWKVSFRLWTPPSGQPYIDLFTIWLTALEGKIMPMDQTLRCQIEYGQRAKWGYIARSRLLAVSYKKKVFYTHIIKPLLKSQRKRKNRTLPISSHLDLTLDQ